MPRFRAEVGPFVGMAGSLNLRYLDGGFTGMESGDGVVGGADLSMRFGYGIEGVIGEEGDGLVYFSLGYSGDTPSSNKFSEAAAAQDSRLVHDRHSGAHGIFGTNTHAVLRDSRRSAAALANVFRESN